MSEKCLELGVMNFFGKIDSGYAVAVENANKEYASTFEGRINAIFKKCIYFWSSRKLRRFLEVLWEETAVTFTYVRHPFTFLLST